MMRLLLAIDTPRFQDEAGTWRAIAKELLNAGIEQVHLLADAGDAAPRPVLLEGVESLTTQLPPAWWRRRRAAHRLTHQIDELGIDVLLASGPAAVASLIPVRDQLDIPLLVDVWRHEQIGAIDSIRADVWLARSEALADALRGRIEHGTVVTTRSPIAQQPVTRMPDKRPSLVVLDPGSRPRDWEPILHALTDVLESRPDLECFMELRSDRSHRLWRQLRQRGLLERVSVEPTAGPLEQLVAAATMVAAPDPAMPCRTIVSSSMAGGAVLLATSSQNDDLIRHGDTAVVVDEATGTAWTHAMESILQDPQRRHDLSRHAIAALEAAAHYETAMPAWITAIGSAAAPASYPLGAS